jgi:penicillin-binding protein 2
MGGRRFHCWKRSGHGRVNVIQSLEQSCDVFYYEVAQKVGIDKIAEMAHRLGVGVRHDLPMSAVAEGVAPTKAWKQERYGKDWRIGDTINASIGQGYVLASPLHLAVMAARIASGRAVVPRLIRSRDGVETPIAEAPPLDISTAMLDQVRRGMNAVMNGSHGTARGSRTVAAEWKMAGKTGTSQVRSAVVNNKNVPWEQRDHALFVAYAPYDNPRYAVSLIIEHGGGGSAAAGPVARDILLFALADGLPPLSAYPENQRSTIRTRQEEMDLVDPASVGTAKSRA